MEHTPRFDGIGGGLPHRPVGIHPPAAALHIGAEPAVIVQVGPAAAPVFGAGSTVLIPGVTGFVAALCIPGAVVLAWKHQVRSFQCKEGRAGFHRPPEGTISRCFGTAPVYRAEIAPIQPRCELHVKPKTFLSPGCLPPMGVLKWQVTAVFPPGPAEFFYFWFGGAGLV